MRTQFILAGISLTLMCSCDEVATTPATVAGSGSASTQTTDASVSGGSPGSSSSKTNNSTTGGNASSNASSDGGSDNSSVHDSSNVATGGKSSSASSSPSTGGTSESATEASTGEIGCDRTGLEAAVEMYLAAIAAGDHSSLPLTSSAKYIENDKTVALGQGLWLAPLKVDFHRNLLDTEACASFTEIIVTDPSHPYVIGTRLKISGSQISEVYAVVTDKGDWLFDAANYLKYSQKEDWSQIPADQRLTREALHDAGYAYFAYWGDKSVEVPWGTPCARLEGGAYTGDSSCNVGIPDQGFAPQPREYLVDVDYGMVVLFLNLGGTDSHFFRVLKTGMRYVHTLTVQ